MDIAITQLKEKLMDRERAIIHTLGKQGRVIIANAKSKHSYTAKNERDGLIALINELDEVCQEKMIKI